MQIYIFVVALAAQQSFSAHNPGLPTWKFCRHYTRATKSTPRTRVTHGTQQQYSFVIENVFRTKTDDGTIDRTRLHALIALRQQQQPFPCTYYGNMNASHSSRYTLVYLSQDPTKSNNRVGSQQKYTADRLSHA